MHIKLIGPCRYGPFRSRWNRKGSFPQIISTEMQAWECPKCLGKMKNQDTRGLNGFTLKEKACPSTFVHVVIQTADFAAHLFLLSDGCQKSH